MDFICFFNFWVLFYFFFRILINYWVLKDSSQYSLFFKFPNFTIFKVYSHLGSHFLILDFIFFYLILINSIFYMETFQIAYFLIQFHFLNCTFIWASFLFFFFLPIKEFLAPPKNFIPKIFNLIFIGQFGLLFIPYLILISGIFFKTIPTWALFVF